MQALKSTALVLLLAVAGCSDDTQLTSPEQDEAAFTSQESSETVSKAILSDRSEWTLMAEVIYTEADGLITHYPCANGGAGEDLVAVAHYQFLFKDVTTPSGKYHRIAKLVLLSGGWKGLSTGDLWEVERLNGPDVLTNLKDGSFFEHQVINEIYNNQDGERFKATTRFRLTMDEAGNLVDFEEKMLSCARLGRK